MRQDLRGRLRPMGIADILDETFELYKSNFVLLVGISAIVYAPYSLLQGLVDSTNSSNPEEMIFRSIIAMSFAALFVLLCQPAVTGALLFAISDRYLGRETSIKSCYQRILKSSVFGRLLGSIVLQYLAICGCVMVIAVVAAIIFPAIAIASRSSGPGSTGTIVLVVLGVLFFIAGIVSVVLIGTRLALVEPAVIVESKGAGQSLNRSWQLMQGNVSKGFLLLLITIVLVLIITLTITGPTSFIQMMAARTHDQVSPIVSVLHVILTMTVSTLTLPFTSIVAILLYYDIRIRKEGFDLELLANELNGTPQQYGAYGQYNLPQEQVASQEYQQEREHPGDNQ